MSLIPADVLERYDAVEPVRVVGIDTASSRMHWHSRGAIVGESYGWAECKDKNPDVRRGYLAEYAAAMFAELVPGTHVFCEEPLSLKNGKTNRLLGLAAGAIWGAFYLAKPDATWHWVDQSTWKKNILGRGSKPKGYEGDEKAWICEAVSNLAGFAANIDPVWAFDHAKQQDLYDAWAIMAYGSLVLPR